MTLLMTTDMIVETYRKTRMSGQGYIQPFGVDEVHTDSFGDKWYIIAVFVNSLDKWLDDQCETNEQNCGHASPHKKWSAYPRYNVHGSLLSFMMLRWA